MIGPFKSPALGSRSSCAFRSSNDIAYVVVPITRTRSTYAPNISKGHTVQTLEILAGYTCSSHSSSSVYQPDPLRFRHKGDTVPYFGTGTLGSERSWPSSANGVYDGDSLGEPSLPSFEEQHRITLRNIETHLSVAPDQGDLHTQHASQAAIDARWQSRTYPVSQPHNIVRFEHSSLPQQDEHAKHIAPTEPELELAQLTLKSFPPIEGTRSDIEEQMCASPSLPRPLDSNNGLTSVNVKIPCPDHQSRTIDSCPRGCSLTLEEAAETGHNIAPPSGKRDQQPSGSLLLSSLTRIFQSRGSRVSTTHGIGPTLDVSSGASNPGIELQPLQNASNDRASVNPSTLEDVEVHPEFDAHRRQPYARMRALQSMKIPGMRPCYILICLGALTVIGSLIPALWQSSVRHDMKGGFSLGQYTLGVGIFAVGSMVAIHSRSCECSRAHDRTILEGRVHR